VIVGIGKESQQLVDVKTADEFQAELAKTRPGREVTLRIVRDGGPTQPIAVTLSRKPLEVMRPEIENIHTRNGTVPNGFVDPPSFLVTLASAGGKPLQGRKATRFTQWLQQGNWETVEHNQSSATFERPIPELQLKVVKRYTLEPVPPASRDDENYPGYDVRLDVEIQNTGDAPQSVAYRLDGPTGLPVEGWWYTHKISQRWFSVAGLRDVSVRFQGSGEVQLDCTRIVDGKTEPMGQDRSLAYAGVDSVYFSSVLIPQKNSLAEDWFDSTEAILIGPKPDPRTTLKSYSNVTCRLTRKPVELAPGGTQRDSYDVFIGPKRPELLAQYQAAGDPNYSLRDLIYYGWFGSVAQIMLGILHFFYSIVGNYGIAIIMLTVLVRGCLFPISYKQTQNMSRMQALKPELDRITEKYKTDMQKRSQAMQELYRKHKINPLGGCLPAFIQLPILIGLYRSIMVDVELRQTPLFGHAIRWCSDLSAPDMLFNWSAVMPQFVNNGIGPMGLGPYFNVLPLVTVALFLVAQKSAMPPPTNEQAAMQQKVMKYMTVFMGVLFYKVASGLCIYFIASSLWGIGERKLLGKGKASDSSASAKGMTPGADRDTSSGGRNGSPGKAKGPKAKRKR
jgi:YidC/Oxa1 family membrane protein insertase